MGHRRKENRRATNLWFDFYVAFKRAIIKLRLTQSTDYLNGNHN